MNGLLLLDKPAGITSHDVVARVRKIMGLREVGHSGTLDPNATGLLVLALGPATKWLPYLPGDKRYAARLRFGIETDSEDIWGKVTREADAGSLNESAVRAALEALRSLTEQVPPMVSALKHAGQPLYQLARRGVEIERAPRPLNILSLEVTTVELPEAAFDVHCGAGTYVRSLCAEAGRQLGCGAAMSSLRRIASGTFTLEQALPEAKWTRADLEGALLGPDKALSHLGRIEMNSEQEQHVAHGRAIELAEAVTEGQSLRLHRADGVLAALAVVQSRPPRWLAQPERVFTAA